MRFIGKNKEEANNPNFQNIIKYGPMVHDWRRYVTQDIKDNWDNLSLETRAALVEVCQEVADNEKWD